AIETSISRLKLRREQLKSARGKFLKNPRWTTSGGVVKEWRAKVKKISEVRAHSYDRLSNFLANSIYTSEKLSGREKAMLSMAADEALQESDLLSELESLIDSEAHTTDLLTRIKQTYEKMKGSIEAHPGYGKEWSELIHFSLKEYAKRAYKMPGSAATKLVMEMRAPVDKFLTLFLGDVFTYLFRRGSAKEPGPIPSVVIAHLKKMSEIKQERDSEPLVVLTHSMGGQVMYDILTHFIPFRKDDKEIRVDFWCATASQVGFFEELKLFLSSSDLHGEVTGEKVPYPDSKYLGYWWNVWDHNDFVSYSAHKIIDGVDDEPYRSGMDVVEAHVGYLFLPSFYRTFAAKVQTACESGWKKKEV
ncbi:MAG: hypothetical protein K8F91_26375, partial [Candidatus Obscuribacterales bacterium]|nr:hypothetical protein [Candidatus Obscuribacterales bacterium]